MKTLEKITNGHLQLHFHCWIDKDQTWDSSHTYPSSLCQNCLSVGTQEARLQPVKHVLCDWLLASMPLCQSPVSTKVFQMKKKANQGLFSQELCATVGFTDQEDGIHQREMHFQPCLRC